VEQKRALTNNTCMWNPKKAEVIWWWETIF